MSEKLNIPITPGSKSTNVTGHGYDEATQTLAIEYGDNVYHYFGVPPEKAADAAIAIEAADVSSGKWVNDNIKGQFDYEKVC